MSVSFVQGRMDPQPRESVNERLASAIISERLQIEILPSRGESLSDTQAKALASEEESLARIMQRGALARERLLEFPKSFDTFRKQFGERSCDVALTPDKEAALLDWAGRNFQISARAVGFYNDALARGLAPLDAAFRDLLSGTFEESFWYIRDVLCRFRELTRTSVYMTMDPNAVESDPISDVLGSVLSLPGTSRITLDALAALTGLQTERARSFLFNLNPMSDPYFGQVCRSSHAMHLVALAAEGYLPAETRTLLLERLDSESDLLVKHLILLGLADQLEHPEVSQATIRAIGDDWANAGEIFDRLIRDCPIGQIPDRYKQAIRYWAWAAPGELDRLHIPIADPVLVQNRIRYLARLLERREAGLPKFTKRIGSYEARCVDNSQQMNAICANFGGDSSTSVGGWSPWLDTRLLLFRPDDTVAVGYLRYAEQEVGDVLRIEQVSFRFGLPRQDRLGLLPALTVGALALAEYRGHGGTVKLTLPAWTYFRFGEGLELAGLPLERFLVDLHRGA